RRTARPRGWRAQGPGHASAWRVVSYCFCLLRLARAWPRTALPQTDSTPAFYWFFNHGQGASAGGVSESLAGGYSCNTSPTKVNKDLACGSQISEHRIIDERERHERDNQG